MNSSSLQLTVQPVALQSARTRRMATPEAAAPGGPCGPWRPGGPAGPSGPGEPAAPAGPGSPCAPGGPAGPGRPATPCGPCELSPQPDSQIPRVRAIVIVAKRMGGASLLVGGAAADTGNQTRLRAARYPAARSADRDCKAIDRENA